MAKKAKKQRKKRDFTKIKGVISTVLKVFKKIAIAIVGLASLIAFLVVPFLHNCIDHTLAQWLWYPAVAILVLGSIVGNARNKRPMFKTPLFEFLGKWGEFSAYPIIISIFVFNYYEIDYAWMWVIFGIIALCVPAFFLSLLSFHIKNDHPSAEAKRQSSVNIMKSIILYWFIDLLYMSIFNDWLIPTFIFGILSIVIIFFNLTNAFLNGAKSLRFFIVLEMILALIMSGYLIFIIPDESLQEIVLTIVAALYGGILTLLGVAWTIKRQDDINHEQEKKNYRPIILVHTSIPPQAHVFYVNNLQNTTATFERTKANIVETYIQTIFLKNTDFSHFYLLGLIVNGEKILIETKRYIHKDDDFAITFSQKTIFTQLNICELALYIQDLLGNYYKIPLSYEVIESNKLEQTYETHTKPEKKIADIIPQIHVIDEQTAIEIKDYK